jgi:hypothetical protein
MARRPVTSASMLSEFQNGHCGATKAGEQTVNRLLSSALKRRRLPPVHFEKAIFTQVAGGLVAHTAAARGHLRRRAYPVGVLVNTMPLFDPITASASRPGRRWWSCDRSSGESSRSISSSAMAEPASRRPLRCPAPVSVDSS